MIRIYKVWNNTDKVKEIYCNRKKNKQSEWRDVLDNSESFTAEEWIKLGVSYTPWNYEGFFWHVEGKPESLAERLACWKLGETGPDYTWACDNRPEDLIECRTDWDSMKNYADELNYFLLDIYDLYAESLTNTTNKSIKTT